MDTTYLREYILAADRHSFTAAARELHVTQSTLSKHMAVLEREFGTDLFTREKSGVVLTTAGQILYKQAVQMVLLEKQTHRLIQQSYRIDDRVTRDDSVVTVSDHAQHDQGDTDLRCKCREAARKFGFSQVETGALVMYLEDRGFAYIQSELGLNRDELSQVLASVYKKIGAFDKQDVLDIIHSVSE